MQDKESQLDIIESRFKNDNEQAATAVISSPATPENLEDHCDGVYDNSHHPNVLRSSDGREEDLLLEELPAPLHFVESWYSVPREERLQAGPLKSQSDGIYTCNSRARKTDSQDNGRLDQPVSLGGHDDLPSSSETSKHELKQSITPSTSSLIPSSRTQFNGVDNNVQQFGYSNGQGGRLDQPAGVGGQDGSFVDSVISTDKLRQIAKVLERESLPCTSTPHQEDRYNVRDSLVSGIVKKEGKSPIRSCPDDTQPTLYFICLFKRRIIARDELEHALYIIPFDQFSKVFPMIKKDEALVYHGTEFPLVEEHRTIGSIGKCLLHRQIEILGNLQVHFKVVHGQNFSIVDPSMRTVTVSEIHVKSKERVTAGFSVEILTRCTGGKDMLYEDNIRVVLQSESTDLHLIFPIAYYEASIFSWLHDTPVTYMPEEDREALRSCHVALLDNIGDAISLCEHLYQHKILDSGDLEEIMDITKKRDRNAYVLRTIQTRGNILDFVIKLMQSKRENQGAAAILQKRRYHGPDM